MNKEQFKHEIRTLNIESIQEMAKRFPEVDDDEFILRCCKIDDRRYYKAIDTLIEFSSFELVE
jgi:hypothetical protein